MVEDFFVSIWYFRLLKNCQFHYNMQPILVYCTFPSYSNYYIVNKFKQLLAKNFSPGCCHSCSWPSRSYCSCRSYSASRTCWTYCSYCSYSTCWPACRSCCLGCRVRASCSACRPASWKTTSCRSSPTSGSWSSCRPGSSCLAACSACQTWGTWSHPSSCPCPEHRRI